MDVLVDGEIVLSGTVGNIFFMEEGFTALDVVKALATLGRGSDVTVRINSGGGIATEGAAIFSALDSHKGKVTVVVEGVAASAASLIAMAGSEVVMRAGSVMMIHDPASFTVGDAAEHSKTIEMLDTIATAMADIYAEKTGKKPDAMRAMMREETWMSATDAKKNGFADRIEKGASPAPTAFDYGLYRNAPERMVALAKSRDWKVVGQQADPSAVTESQEEITMADNDADGAAKILADKLAADKLAADAKAKADAAAAAAGTETPEQITARVTAEVTKRHADINALCTMQGKSSLATGFITAGKSVSEVIAALNEDKSDPDPEIIARGGGKTGKADAAEVKAGWDKATDRVNGRISK